MTPRVLGMAVLLIAGCGVAAAQADLDDTISLLKGAEAQKDIPQIEKLAVQAITDGRKEVAAAAADKERAAAALSVQEYGEFALMSAAVSAPAAAKVELLAMLEQNSPKSKYLDAAYHVYIQALRDTGAAAKIPAIAEKALANFPDNQDLLSVALEDAAAKQESDHVLSYADRLAALVSKSVKPADMPDADWEKRRAAVLGTCYFYTGRVYYTRNQYVQADKSLRAALPYVRGNATVEGLTLLLLGGANYQIGKALNSKAKVQEGANFCAQASKVSFPQASEAWRQSQLMAAEAAKMR